MKTLLQIIISLTINTTLFAQQEWIKDLELKECKQMTNYEGRFDLSGMTTFNDSIYIIADKKENHFIYKLNWNQDNWTVTPAIDILIKNNNDFEGVSYYKDNVILINEADNSVYALNLSTKNTKLLPIDWSNLSLPRNKWMKNAGFEGVAINTKEDILYLAKERDPRIIIEVDLKTNKIIDEYDLKKSCSKDFADLYYYNGYLYGLERNAQCIAKIDLETKKIVQHYSFKKSTTYKGEKLYEPAKYGMAEALMIKNDQIWIGWDNNGVEVSSFAKDKYNIKGDLPVILIFDKPIDF